MKLIFDFGHGTRNWMNGTKQSPDRTFFEGEYNRRLGTEIVRRLQGRGHDVTIAVPEDRDIPLAERVRRINRLARGCDALLVSVHCNAAGNGTWNSARGFSVFVSKNSSRASKECARIFTELAAERNLLGNRSVPAEKYWTWSWTSSDIYILKNTTCPAVLTENLFYDNREDLRTLKSDEGFEALVSLHVDAVEKFIKANS